MKEYKKIYQEWLNDEYFDEEFREELRNLKEDEIEERFFMDLEFGTAGLRGILGAGRNRMNKYIIRRATQGYANYLLTKNNVNPSCVIAHDIRHGSELFNKECASVLVANGIKTYIFNGFRSTPQLSYAVRQLKTTGGVVITASHNPKEYNGYKVYNDNGGQLLPDDADALTAQVESITDFKSIKYMDFKEAQEKGMIVTIDEAFDDEYLDAVLQERRHPEIYSEDFKFVYTPMHGVGSQIMPKLFNKLGVKDCCYFEEQMVADPNFSSVPKPNPEELGALEKSIKYAKEVDAGLVVATDPDSDRMSIAVRDRSGEFHQLNGNEIGSLLTYYVYTQTSNLPEKTSIVKTIVTGDLPFAIAKSFGGDYAETLTGFKFIGEQADKFLAEGKQFLLGFEEAIGFLVGTHVRDKDGVVATMIAVEMAKYYHSKGLTILDVLEEVYEKYGYYQAETISKVYPGIEGMQIIKQLMDSFRGSFDSTCPISIVKMNDYSKLVSVDMVSKEESVIDGYKSNVLKYYFDNNDWVCVRPSGTEPKIKFYYCVSSSSLEKSKQRLKQLQAIVEEFCVKSLG